MIQILKWNIGEREERGEVVKFTHTKSYIKFMTVNQIIDCFS